jgi:hypothetical protein
MSPQLVQLLEQHTRLHATFNSGVDADLAKGSSVAAINSDVVQHIVEGNNGFLRFSAKDHGWAEDEFTFSAQHNFPYKESAFEGTISLWLRGDPDLDLNDEFPVDPFHISRHAADGSFYLDLTRPNDWRYGSPRKLRFGIYGDSPAQDMFVGGQLLVVGDLGWSDTKWHHLAATFQNVNSRNEDGSAALYIDGVQRSTMNGYRHDLTWQTDKMTIGLGQRFVGDIDELLILDKSLSSTDVSALFNSGR